MPRGGVDALHATASDPSRLAGHVDGGHGAGGVLAEWGLSRWVAPFVSAEAVFPLVRHPFRWGISGWSTARAVSFRGAIGCSSDSSDETVPPGHDELMMLSRPRSPWRRRVARAEREPHVSAAPPTFDAAL